MKVSGIILFVLMVVLPFTTVGQSAYKGGEGDGYDMAELAQFNVSVERTEEALAKVQVYPSVISVGEEFRLDIPEGYQLEDLSLRLLTVDGKVVKKFESVQPGKLKAPGQPGFYFVEVRMEGRSRAFKMVMK